MSQYCVCVCVFFFLRQNIKKINIYATFMQRIKYVYRPYATQLSHDIITFGLMMSLTYVSSIPLKFFPDYVFIYAECA